MSGILLTASFNPAPGFVDWIVIGGFAGWIGSKVMNIDEQMGIVLSIVVGIVDGFLDGWLLAPFGIDIANDGMPFSFLTYLLSAVILLRIIGLVQKRK